jgi:hypothetical protein
LYIPREFFNWGNLSWKQKNISSITAQHLKEFIVINTMLMNYAAMGKVESQIFHNGGFGF